MAPRTEAPALVAEILAEGEQRKISPEEVVRQALSAQRARAKGRYHAIRSRDARLLDVGGDSAQTDLAPSERNG